MDSQLYLVPIIIILTIVIFYIYKSSKKNKHPTGKFGDTQPTVKKLLNESSHNTIVSGVDEDSLRISEVTQLVLKDSLGGELTFNRPNEQSERKYYEVGFSKAGKVGGHLTQAGLPIATRANTIAEIKSRAPDGLFQATVNPDKLTKFSKDGTYSTMVHGPKGKILENKGFIKTDVSDLVAKQDLLSSVNMGMQGMAAVSGQYYLEEITSQLNDIDTKINKLIEYHHDEKLAVLKNAQIRLEEIVKRENVDLNDIDEIRELRNSVREVFQEYRTRLHREADEVSKFKSSSMLVNKRVSEYMDEIDEINFNIQVCYQADKLSIQAELAEISIRMKLNHGDPMLKDLYVQLKENSDKSFIMNISERIGELYRTINNHAEEVVRKGKDFLIIDRNREELLNSIYQISHELEKELNSKDSRNIITQSLEEKDKEQEVIILPDTETGESRVYIHIEEKKINKTAI